MIKTMYNVEIWPMVYSLYKYMYVLLKTLKDNALQRKVALSLCSLNELFLGCVMRESANIQLFS